MKYIAIEESAHTMLEKNIKKDIETKPALNSFFSAIRSKGKADEELVKQYFNEAKQDPLIKGNTTNLTLLTVNYMKWVLKAKELVLYNKSEEIRAVLTDCGGIAKALAMVYDYQTNFQKGGLDLEKELNEVFDKKPLKPEELIEVLAKNEKLKIALSSLNFTPSTILTLFEPETSLNSFFSAIRSKGKADEELVRQYFNEAKKDLLIKDDAANLTRLTVNYMKWVLKAKELVLYNKSEEIRAVLTDCGGIAKALAMVYDYQTNFQKGGLDLEKELNEVIYKKHLKPDDLIEVLVKNEKLKIALSGLNFKLPTILTLFEPEISLIPAYLNYISKPENQAECNKLSDKSKSKLVKKFFLNNYIYKRSAPLESLTPDAKKELQNWVKCRTKEFVVEQIADQPKYAEMLDTALSACADDHYLLRKIIVKILSNIEIITDIKYSKENISYFQNTLAKVAHSINMLADKRRTINTIIEAIRALHWQDTDDDYIAATGLFLDLLEKLKVNFSGLSLEKHKAIFEALNKIPLKQSKSIILEAISKKGFDRHKFNLFDQFPIAESLLFEPGMSTYRFNTAAYLMQQYCNPKKDTIVHWLVRASFVPNEIDSHMAEIKSKIAGARQANLIPQNFNQRNSAGETPLQIFGRKNFAVIKDNLFPVFPEELPAMDKALSQICKTLSEKLTAAFTWEEDNEPVNAANNPDPEYAIRLFIAASANDDENKAKAKRILCNPKANPSQITAALGLTYNQTVMTLFNIMSIIYETAVSDNAEEKQALLSNTHVRFFLYHNKDLLKVLFNNSYETSEKKNQKQLSLRQQKLIQTPGFSQFADYLTDKENFFKARFASFFYRGFLQGKWLTDAKSSVDNSTKFKY